MAKLMWLFLAFTMSILVVSANECSDLEKIMNCNECFRCGGKWCKDPKEDVHCVETVEDIWCPMSKESAHGEEVSNAGDLLDPNYVETTAFVGTKTERIISYQGPSKPRGMLTLQRSVQKEKSIVVESTYPEDDPCWITSVVGPHGSTSFKKKESSKSVDSVKSSEVTLKIMNTTQNNEFDVSHSTECRNNRCSTVIDALAKPTFCSPTARTSEFVTLKVAFDGLSEETTLKYMVPCACECSDTVVKYARECNGRGDLSCGVCSCHEGWTGPECNKMVCGARRGDVRCNNPSNNLECSGNGYCGDCDTCICYNDRVGSKYFNEDYYCEDICMTTNDCDLCLRDPTPGRCSQCNFLFYQNFNDTLLEERDSLNRSIWVMCNETMSDGYRVEYVVMRNELHETYFMIPPSKANQAAVGGGGTNVALPLGLALLAILVGVTAIGGYMYHKRRLPPVPPTDPMYTNIDAEDCTGENPLYKSPMSCFKNPTYGKW